MEEYFISKEFDEKLKQALDLYNKKKMAELDEEMKGVNITFSKEFEEKMRKLIDEL